MNPARAVHEARGPARAKLSLVAIVLASAMVTGGAATATASQAWRLDAVSNTTVVPGGTHRYVVEARNSGDAPMDGSEIVVRATLPRGLTAVSGDLLQFGEALFPCTAANGDPIAGASEIVCRNTRSLGIQRTQALRLTVAVDPSASGTLVANFAVSGGGAADGATTLESVRIGEPPAFGVDSFDGESVADANGAPYTQAGGRPYAVSTSIDFNTVRNPRPLIGDLWPVESVKDLFVELPPGLVGSVAGLAKCKLSELANAEGNTPLPLCSPASQIGTTVIRWSNTVGNSIFGPLPVFNVVTPPGVPARFGFNVGGAVVVLDAEVRSNGDYGITVAARNISQALAIAGTTVTFWGVPADAAHDGERACAGRPAPGRQGPACASGAPRVAFLRNPTSCTAPGVGLVTRLRMDSWLRPGVFSEGAFVSHLPFGYPHPPSSWGLPQGPDGCVSVPFDPVFTAAPAAPAEVATPTGFTFDLEIPQTDDPRAIAQSDLKKAVVTLPRGVRVSPSSAHGLGACAPQQIRVDDGSRPSCPENSKIGSATIDTPLLDDPLDGHVYLATPHSNPFSALIAVYLVVEGPGVVVKVPGRVAPDPESGQLTATFDNNPQLPFSRLHLAFNDGPAAPLATPRACGTYTTRAELTGWSGKIASSMSTFSLDKDATGTSCPAPRFSPRFTAGTENPTGGKASALNLAFSRGDQDEELQALTVNLPTGLLGRIASVDLCGDAEASMGTCGEGSRLGRVTVGAGAGSSPFYIDAGRAYLTGPYKGAPFGLAIVVPAVAGPFNLGTVVVRSALFVDRHDARVRVVSDPLPRILEGIPLDVRDVRVSVDRRDFIINPTSCAEKRIDGVIASTEGRTAAVASRFQVADCARLPLRPTMTLQVGGRGRTGRGGSTPFVATLRQTPGQAALRFVRVTLPTTINARLTVINDACTRAEYDSASRECERARTGSAIARTPLLRDELRGNVYFVRNGNPLPDLFVRLRGQVDFDLVGRITIPGSKRLRTTFDAVPDVPISSFQLRLVAGKDGSIGTATNLCSRRGRTAKAELDFRGQNGKVVQLDQRLKIRGCNRARGRGGSRGRRGRRR